jgi:hypothetical protein
MTYATNAVADQLKGTYGFTATGICLYALPDFLTNVGVPFIASEGAYFTQYFDNQGTVTFNGDGTGTGQLTSMGFRLPPQLNIFDPFANSTTSTFSFTYTVTDDTLTTNNVLGTFKGTTTVGFGAGSTFTIENLPPLIIRPRLQRVEKKRSAVRFARSNVERKRAFIPVDCICQPSGLIGPDAAGCGCFLVETVTATVATGFSTTGSRPEEREERSVPPDVIHTKLNVFRMAAHRPCRH